MRNSNNYNKVFELDLSNKSLKTLSKEILNYTNLKVLNISNNQLTELPEFLKKLKHLEKINISNNQFINLPDFFRSFKVLSELNISNNPLTYLPFSFWKLSSLKELNISNLNLKELPNEVGNLKALTILTINDLGLTSLPETIGYLSKLEDISLKNNQLTKLPRTFVSTYIRNLRKLNLRGNKFQVFPKSIFNFKELVYLDVSNNSIQVIPQQIGLLKKITYLNISENKIREIPRSLYSLSFKRTHFHFKNNPLSKFFLDEINRNFVDKSKENQLKYRESKKPQKNVLNKSGKKIKGKEYNFDTSLKLYLQIVLVMSTSIFFYLSNKDAEIVEEDNKNTINNVVEAKEEEKEIKEDPKKDYKDYVLAKEKLENSLQRVLKKTEEVFIYTNDPAKLKLTIRPNAKFSKKGYQDNHDDKRKAKYLNKFLNNKRYGYSVDLDNGRTKFAQMWIHDSIIFARFSKKFRVVRYYRMTPEEKIYNIKRDKERVLYRKKPRNDKIFAINRGLVDFIELRNKKFRVKTRAIFTPKNIDITRRENYFYFSSLNANITKEEFLKAVKEFKEMFITKGNPEESCFVKTLKVNRE